MGKPDIQRHQGGPGLNEVGLPQLAALIVRREDAVGFFRVVYNFAGQLRNRLRKKP